MSRKYFLILGLFLVTGFLFLNTNSVLAAERYWTGNQSTSTIGGKDFWNPENWDTQVVPAINDDVWIFASSTLPLQATVIISTPVDLGTGKIYLGYNQKGNTLANSSAPLTLLIREGASLTNRNLFEVGTSSTVLLTSGSLSVGTTTMKQYASTTISSVTGATSTVTIKGDWTFLGGATYTSPANSTTTITGTTQANTITSTSTTALTFGYLVFSGADGTTNLQASTTVANRLSISAGRTLDAEGAVIALTGSNSNSMTFPFEVTGTFTAATSTVTYSGTGATTVASTTYSKVNWNGAATYTLNGATTVTNAGTVASGATLALLANTLTATGSTWTNNGTVSRTTGKITLASASRFDDGTGTAKSAFDGDARNRVGIQVTDTSLNYDAAVAETQTATITAKSMISDVETVTLTESAVGSGIFRGSVIMGLSGSNVGDQLDFQGSGTLRYTFTDSQDSSDTGTGGAATFTGTSPGGGGGSVSYVATPVTPAVPATPATSTVTPAVPATPATPAVPAAPSLDNVQTKIASVVTKIAALTKSSPAADIAAVQAEIAAILNDIKAIQAAQPASQGVALGFNFVRPLALGMRHADVTKLQEALKTDSSIYPEGTVTGYFGPATLRAVQKFQEKYEIAQSGGVGYGSVGPKTRAKLNELYGRSQ